MGIHLATNTEILKFRHKVTDKIIDANKHNALADTNIKKKLIE